MVEQYIYSRSEKAFVNEMNEQIPIGYGFMAKSEGLVENGAAVLRALEEYCSTYTNKKTVNGADEKIPVARKIALLEGQKILLQQTTGLKGQRDSHIAHGYVFDAQDAQILSPEAWLGLPYISCDVNEARHLLSLHALQNIEGHAFVNATQPEGAPSTAMQTLAMWSLAKTLAKTGITADNFKRIVRACFDALTLKKQVLIAHDFKQEDAVEVQKQLLCWVYTCLPFALRRFLNFDSVYTERTAPAVFQLTFVDMNTQIQKNSAGYTLKTGQVGAHYLFVGDSLMHRKTKDAEHCESNSPFARWLDAVIDVFLGQDAIPEAQAVTRGQLYEVYRFFDHFLQGLAPVASCKATVYDALCLHYLTDGNGTIEESVHIEAADIQVEFTQEEVRTCSWTLVDLQETEQTIQLACSILADFASHINRSLTEDERNILQNALQKNKVVAHFALQIATASLLQTLRNQTNTYEDVIAADVAWMATTGTPLSVDKTSIWQAIFFDGLCAQEIQRCPDAPIFAHLPQPDALRATWIRQQFKTCKTKVEVAQAVKAFLKKVEIFPLEQQLKCAEELKNYVAEQELPNYTCSISELKQALFVLCGAVETLTVVAKDCSVKVAIEYVKGYATSVPVFRFTDLSMLSAVLKEANYRVVLGACRAQVLAVSLTALCDNNESVHGAHEQVPESFNQLMTELLSVMHISSIKDAPPSEQALLARLAQVAAKRLLNAAPDFLTPDWIMAASWLQQAAAVHLPQQRVSYTQTRVRDGFTVRCQASSQVTKPRTAVTWCSALAACGEHVSQDCLMNYAADQRDCMERLVCKMYIAGLLDEIQIDLQLLRKAVEEIQCDRDLIVRMVQSPDMMDLRNIVKIIRKESVRVDTITVDSFDFSDEDAVEPFGAFAQEEVVDEAQSSWESAQEQPQEADPKQARGGFISKLFAGGKQKEQAQKPYQENESLMSLMRSIATDAALLQSIYEMHGKGGLIYLLKQINVCAKRGMCTDALARSMNTEILAVLENNMPLQDKMTILLKYKRHYIRKVYYEE